MGWLRLNARPDMHELAIAQNILQIAREEAKKLSLDGCVERIYFRAGRLNAVIPDILVFNFDVIKVDFPEFKETSLEVEQIPISIRCKDCQIEAELEEPVFVCLECGGAVEVLSGQEMFVDRIVMKGTSHGN